MKTLRTLFRRCCAQVSVLALLLALVWDTPTASAHHEPSELNEALALEGSLVSQRKRRKRRRKGRRKGRKKKAVKAVVAEPKPAPKPTPEVAPEPAAEPAAEPVEEERDTRLAVMDLRLAKGIDPSVGGLLNETIISKLDATGQFQSIISGSDMRDMIDLETQKMALGCDQDSCLAELGGALGVPYMLVSNLGRFGQQYILNIKFVAVEEAKVLGRVNKILADEAKVLEALAQALQEIVDSALGPVEDEEPTVADGCGACAGNGQRTCRSQPAEAKSSGRVSERPLVWLGIGVMAGGAGAGYWSQQSVLEAKDSYYAQEQVAELEPTAATLQATDDFWNDWQAASDRHAWMQPVSNAALVIGAGLSAYAALFGGS